MCVSSWCVSGGVGGENGSGGGNSSSYCEEYGGRC